MIFELILVSKPNFSQVKELVSKYETRLKRYTRVTTLYLRDEKKLLNRIDTEKAFNAILDERGEEMTSLDLAKQVQDWQKNSTKLIRFCVGDAYGFSDTIRKKANHLWKLSDLTLPGDFAWLILHEQLFRAFSILHKTGYHHG